jgi:hypothetical protein
MKNVLLTLLLATSGSLASHAQTTFIFHQGASLGSGAAGTALEGQAGSVGYTLGGITLTAEAFLAGASANTEFHGLAAAFGIDSDGADDNDRFENDLGIESMVFSFDTNGVFNTLDLRYIEEDSNEAVLSFDGGGTYQLTSVTATSGNDDFNIGENFTAGELITLTLHASAPVGEDFSLESFTVTAVPEPSSFAALAGLVILGFAGCLRRRGSRTIQVVG